MEHILISSGKIKLVLTKEDIKKYELGSVIDENCEIVHKKSFKALIKEARELGFDVGDENDMSDRLFIQLYPSKDGGAEVYMTKLGERTQNDDVSELPIIHIGCFSSLDDLAFCCKHLDKINCESSAWYDEVSECWYLTVFETLNFKEYLEHGLSVDAIIGEFGKNITSRGAIYYIKEHCLAFCEKKAVKILKNVI